MGRITGGLAALAAAVAVVCVWWFGFIPHTERELIRKAKVVAAANLLDPNSAQFRKLTTGVLKDGKLKGQAVVCGEINGKNVHGAYAGYSRFVASLDPKGGASIEPDSVYSDEELKNSQAKCKAGAESRSNDMEVLTEAKLMCEHVLDVMVDRQPVVAFQGIWENSGCTLPAQ